MKLNIAYVTVLIAAIMIPSAFADSVTTQIDSTNYDIEYTGNNVVLKSATADLDFISLIFEIEVTGSEGDVTITFQREYTTLTMKYLLNIRRKRHAGCWSLSGWSGKTSAWNFIKLNERYRPPLLRRFAAKCIRVALINGGNMRPNWRR